MDREQHIAQDAAEFYAVYMMAKTAEELNASVEISSSELWDDFTRYLSDGGRSWTVHNFETVHPAYKKNVDAQIPKFVHRLLEKFPGATFTFAIDEVNQRILGNKADFILNVSSMEKTHYVSLKNYVGTGGIKRPQVSSGTFLSFAAGFVFERSGVGVYEDPRTPGTNFKGSNSSERNAVLRHQGRGALIEYLESLENLQSLMRGRLLTLRYYDRAKIRSVVEEIVPVAQKALIGMFETLGADAVRRKFLQRAGLDGAEDVLYFDRKDFVDSITNARFSDLHEKLNDPETEFTVEPVGQSLRFSFIASGGKVLSADVPLTVNTNGAWHRPTTKYAGKQVKNDKGHMVELEWGEIRPYKSKEIATSTNLYVDLVKTGVFNY